MQYEDLARSRLQLRMRLLSLPTFSSLVLISSPTNYERHPALQITLHMSRNSYLLWLQHTYTLIASACPTYTHTHTGRNTDREKHNTGGHRPSENKTVNMQWRHHSHARAINPNEATSSQGQSP